MEMLAAVQCLNHAHLQSSDFIQSAQEELSFLTPKIQDIKAVISKATCGVEVKAARALQEELIMKDMRKRELESLVECTALGLKELSLTPLRWRHKNGTPRLALFPVHAFEMKIGVRKQLAGFLRREYVRYFQYVAHIDCWDQSLNYSLSEKTRDEVVSCFADIYTRLEKMTKTGRTTWLKTAYAGIVPDNIKQSIQKYAGRFGRGGLYILAEATAWLVTQEENSPINQSRDPLLLGYDGFRFWVLDHFDLTPIESVTENEFVL